MKRTHVGLDPGWLQHLRERLDRPPAPERAALLLARAGAPAPALIGSIEAALAHDLAEAGLPLCVAGAAWLIDGPAASEADATLAAISRWLYANGRGSAWRNELLAVTDERGDAVAAIERAAVRPLGIATHAVHLVARDTQGRVWVQQRAFDKSTDPGLWDTTMGGLMAAGETPAQTLARETWEEAGLRIDELQALAPIGRATVRRPLAEGYMVERIEMFEALVPDGSVPVNQDGEVVRFEAMEPAALIERLHADAFTLEAALILANWLGRIETPAPCH